MQELRGSRSFESLLNDRYRGAHDRDFQVWGQQHAYEEVEDIPADATKAWISRRKFNYRGISERFRLKHLISGNVDQAFLDEIGSLHNLERLELEWPLRAQDLTPLLALKMLTHLSIDSPRNIADFRLLMDIPSLKTLFITNAKKMENLDWLAQAHHLEVIGIEGALDTPYKIPSLKPLEGLRSLRAFFGTSTSLADKDLTPLASCPRLEYLSIARVVKQDQFIQLKDAKPGLVCRWFRPEMWDSMKLVAT